MAEMPLNSSLRIAGGAKKRKTVWTVEIEEILFNCGISVREKCEESPEVNFQRTLYEVFCEEYERIIGEKFKGTEASVITKFSKLEVLRPKPETVNLKWNDYYNSVLLKCGLEAMAMKERNKSLSYITLMYEKFIAIVDEYNGTADSLRGRFNEILNRVTEELLIKIREEIEDELTAEDLANSKHNFNLPLDLRKYSVYNNIGKKHGAKNLFCGMCSYCGKLLFGDSRNDRWKRIQVKTTVIPVGEYYEDMPKNIPFGDLEHHLICRVCQKDKDVLMQINLRNPETNTMSIPQVLIDINRPIELGMIALLGVYHSLHTPKEPKYRRYDHLQGEVNLLTKGEQAYIEMFGIMIDKKDKQTARMERIKKALIWLKENNVLFKEFHANCETLYSHFKGNNPILLKSDKTFESKKGKDIGDELGEEEMGYFLPAENFADDYDFKDDDFPIGIVHPRTKEEAEKSMIGLTKPGIFNPNLEALAFPKDFPGGTGSYNPKGNVSHRNWCKLILLNLSERYRRNRYLPFFCIDRYVKISLINHQRMVIAPVGDAATDKPKVGDLFEKQPYKRYGNKVPATIPGSRSYWFTKKQEVHAITIDMGRRPDYFITITANDNWPEIQRIVCFQTSDTMDDCTHGDSPHPAVDYPTECSIAFHQRWSEWKKAVLLKCDGELGRVERYWFRREYQKRGMVHMHGAVWVDPESKTNESVVRAEMPRGPYKSEFLEELRGLVKKFQIHNHIPDRCYFAGTKRLKKCKYGFPAPLVNETRPDETGLRKLYRRREKEDECIVPYSFSLLLIIRAHVNIQEVSENGWEMYLTKYMTKPEPVARMRLGAKVNPKATNVEKYLTMRVMGAVEANDILMQFPATDSNVEVIYLPIEVEPTTKVLKRKKHLSKDTESVDVYYDSKIEKYYKRPIELSEVTYPGFFRKYTYSSKKSRTDGESEGSDDENPELDTTTEMRDLSNLKRVVVERKNPIVVRFPFLLPYGEELERFCLKLLFEGVPIRRPEDLISDDNISKTYLEECTKRSLWDPLKVSLAFLSDAEKMGFNELRLREFAGILMKYNYLGKVEVQEFLNTLSDRDMFANFPEYTIQFGGDDKDAYGAYPIPDLNLEPLSFYVESFNEEQRRIYNTITDSIRNKDQILATVVGPAGTGKSHLLRALCAHCLANDKDQFRAFCVLAPTGSAAYLIKGRTIHSMFKFDTYLKSHVRYASVEAFLIKYCDLWLIDEMSMIDDSLLEAVELNMKKHSLYHERHKPFGGKDVILFGDPAQLPSRNIPFFCGDLFHKRNAENNRLFKVFTLKQIVRQEDLAFARILQRVRVADINEEVIAYFKNLLLPKNTNKKILYKEIIDNNIHVVVAKRYARDGINNEILDLLPGELKVFNAKDSNLAGGSLSEAQALRLEDKPEKFRAEVRIKIGALVIMKRNINTAAGQVNGRTAIVESIGDDHIILRSLDGNEHWPVYMLRQTIQDFGEDAYVRLQIPIDLGWAVTVHTVQGMTLDRVIVNLDRDFFDSGMAYVALTRVRKPENLRLLKFVHSKIMLNEFYKELLVWIEKNDEYSSDQDREYPFPKWVVRKRFSDKEESDKRRIKNGDISDHEGEDINPPPSPTKRKNVNKDEPMPSPTKKGREDTQEEDQPMPSQPLSEPMNTQSQWPLESLPEECERRLKNILNDGLFEQTGQRLRDYFLENEEFCIAVTNALRSREPIAMNECHLRRVGINPRIVPRIMISNFNQIRVPGDGNCFYYAVSVALFGVKDYMSLIRFGALMALSDERYVAYFQEFSRRYNDGLLVDMVKSGTITSESHRALRKYPKIKDLEFEVSWANSTTQLATAVAINRRINLYMEGISVNIAPWPGNDDITPVCVVLESRHIEPLIPNTPEAIVETPRGFGVLLDHRTHSEPRYPVNQ